MKENAGCAGFRYPADQGIVYEVLARQAPVVVAEYATDPRRVDFLADVLSGLHTVVGIPTVVRGRALGVLYCLFAVPGRVVTEAEIEVLNLLAGHAGAALANAEVYEEVLRSHEHERAVFDSIADGVATVGPDGLVATWNRAAHAITGIPAARAVGRPVPFPVGWPGEPVGHEVSEGRWIESIATPLWASPQTVIAFRDITRQKELEEAKDVKVRVGRRRLPSLRGRRAGPLRVPPADRGHGRAGGRPGGSGRRGDLPVHAAAVGATAPAGL